MSGFNYSFQRASIDNSYDPEHRNSLNSLNSFDLVVLKILRNLNQKPSLLLSLMITYTLYGKFLNGYRFKCS